MPCTLSRAPLVAITLLVAACHPLGTPPTLEERLEGVEVAIGTSPSRGARYLRYTVEGDQGRWVHEILVDGSAYAERRMREDGRKYAFGRDGRGT